MRLGVQLGRVRRVTQARDGHGGAAASTSSRLSVRVRVPHRHAHMTLVAADTLDGFVPGSQFTTPSE